MSGERTSATRITILKNSNRRGSELLKIAERRKKGRDVDGSTEAREASTVWNTEETTLERI